MKQTTLIFTCILLMIPTMTYSNIDLYETFEAGFPDSWSTTGSIATSTWMLQPANEYFPTQHMAAERYGVRLLTPWLDIDDATEIALTCDYFVGSFNQDDISRGIIEYRWDGMEAWTRLTEIIPNAQYEEGQYSGSLTSVHILDHTSVQFAFRARDNFHHWYGMYAVDNVRIDISPDTAPIRIELTAIVSEVPEGGGEIVYDAHFVSELPVSINRIMYWTRIEFPGGQQLDFTYHQNFRLVPFMDATAYGLTQTVPAFAPPGLYTLYGFVGYPPNQNLQIVDSFNFTKAGEPINEFIKLSLDDWSARNLFIQVQNDIEQLPQPYSMISAYPNPFNPSTLIRIRLPESSKLTVLVYNVNGQVVAELVNGSFNAGTHNLTFDASNLASGLYFIQAQVPGKLNETQKVMLVR